ncbi:MAG TPA: hypothetical protein GX506_08180 [Firmicutes bacterium]|nr:hypothetical protein [Bacillota bacterium]
MWSGLKGLVRAPLDWARDRWAQARWNCRPVAGPAVEGGAACPSGPAMKAVRPVVKILHGAGPRRNSAKAPGLESGAGLKCCPTTLDEIGVSLSELNLILRRWFTSDLPHEVSVVIPHAEVRIRKGRGTQETEIVLESITVIHSPRFPPKSGFRKDGGGDEGEGGHSGHP